MENIKKFEYACKYMYEKKLKEDENATYYVRLAIEQKLFKDNNDAFTRENNIRNIASKIDIDSVLLSFIDVALKVEEYNARSGIQSGFDVSRQVLAIANTESGLDDLIMQLKDIIAAIKKNSVENSEQQFYYEMLNKLIALFSTSNHGLQKIAPESNISSFEVQRAVDKLKIYINKMDNKKFEDMFNVQS